MNRSDIKINSLFGLTIITSLMIGQSFNGFGQDDWSEPGEIENAEIIIEKDRQVTLPAVIRPYSKIPPDDASQTIIPQTYDFNNYILTGSVYDPNLQAKVILPNENKNSLQNYVKGGLGNYASFLAEASLNTSSKNFAAGLFLKHKSFARGPVDRSNSAAGDTEALLFTRLAQKKSVLSVDLGFNSVQRHYYGYGETPATSDEVGKQVYNTFDFSIGLKSTDEQSGFDYDSKISLYRLGDKFDASESGFKIDLNSKVALDEGIAIRLNSTALLSKYKDNSSQSRNLVKFISGIDYALGKLSIIGAANLVLSNDSVVNAKNFRIYPYVIVNYKLNDSWNINGGLRGDLESVTLRSISKENEYINNNLPLFHSNKKIEIFGQVDGNFSSNVGIAGGFSFANFENLYFYANAFKDSTKFDLLYDFDGTSVLNLFASFTVSPVEDLTINSRVDYFKYNTKINSPLHRPDYSGSIFINYELNRKFLIRVDGSITGGIKGLNLQSASSQKLSAFADLNLNFEYQLNKNLGVFLQINNLLNQDYERYLNYKNRALMVLASVRYQF
ncbi:MAG: TonB-dependent receptor [Bacteroidetes bacterium]|nr:TonB-dependent receptor [Bacteroidota bacterium]MDA1121382.1 TonB-dependent receptor [Bacteroidota bacterium]